MMRSDLSVIIPSYNRADLVGIAVRSVLAQTLAPLEVIVVDDASTDETSNVLSSFGDEIRVIRTPRNLERGAARNLAASVARGSHLAFLDSDDEWKPDKLESQVALLPAGRPSVTGIERFDPTGTTLGTCVPPPDGNERILLENPFPGAASTLVVPKDMFARTRGFPEERAIQGSEDWVFLAKLIRAGYRVAIVPKPLVRVRIHSSSWTASPDNIARSMWSAVCWLEQRRVVSGSKRRRLRARTASTIARNYAYGGRPREAIKWGARTMVHPVEAARSAALIPGSGVSGLLKRGGWRSDRAHRGVERTNGLGTPDPAVSRKAVIFSPGHAEIGGAARRARAIAEALSRRGWRVWVVTRAGTLSRPRLFHSGNLTVWEVPGFNRRRLGAALFMATAVPLGLIAGPRATFVSIQLTSQSLAASLCAWAWRRPFLAFTTTSGSLSEVQRLNGSLGAGLRRRLVARAAYLVAQTDAAASELQSLVPGERTAVIPNPAAAAERAPLNGRPRAVFTGRFSEEKDLLGLLDAWEQVAVAHPDARLRLVGEAGQYRPVETLLREKVAVSPLLRTTVEFTGWVEDVGRELRAADVYAFPSLSEGMSNSLLEACAWGRIVVASDIASNRAVLGDDYPLLFPAGDRGALATALRRALTEPLTRERAREHLARRMDRFSLDSVVDRLEALIVDANRSRH